MINYEDFQKLDLRVAKIISAEQVVGSDKLIKLELAAGDADESGALKNRQIIAGIGKAYTPEDLVSKGIVIVANLEPRTFTLQQSSGQVGIESQGMLLAVINEAGEPVILIPEKPVLPGTKVK